jgi:ribonuclease-3
MTGADAGLPALAQLLVSDERKKLLENFQNRLPTRFRSLELLNLSFCHSSFANEFPAKYTNNEKLEFLGDSVLGLLIAEKLYHLLPDKTEGDLAKIKAFVVCEDSLARIAQTLAIPDCLLIGKGEELSGGRQKKAILADCLEAIIGALYIDQGLDAVKQFVSHTFAAEIQSVLDDRHQKDYKTLLQEYTQKHLRLYPKYLVVSRTGPDHAKTFGMEVQIGEQTWGPACGSSKKEAEQAVAYLAWRAIESGTFIS